MITKLRECDDATSNSDVSNQSLKRDPAPVVGGLGSRLAEVVAGTVVWWLSMALRVDWRS
jgi:hypothetical protein